MVNWATALNCKRCACFFQAATTSVTADANGFETVSAQNTFVEAPPVNNTFVEAAPVQDTFVENAPEVDTRYSPDFNKPAFDSPPPNRAGNQQYNQDFGQQNFNQNRQQDYRHNPNYNRNFGQNYYQQPAYGQNAQPSNPKIGLAVTSMIFGILGLVTAIFLLGILLAPIGLILGIIALVKVKNKPHQYGGKGFAIAGVVTSALVSLFIPIVLAIAIPNILAARDAANEAYAISVLSKLADAESDYRKGAGRGYCADMKTLAAANVVDAETLRDKNGFRFNIVNYPLGGCEITATPVSAPTKMRSFYYSTDDNQIRGAKKNGKPAEKSDSLLKDDYKKEEAEKLSKTESPDGAIPNEAIALADIKSIDGAQSTYVATVGQGECCGDFKSLADMQLIKPGLADGEDGGYRFKITKLAKGNYEVTATPISASYNSRSFFKSPLDGLRGGAKNGLPADKNDPPVDY